MSFGRELSVRQMLGKGAGRGWTFWKRERQITGRLQSSSLEHSRHCKMFSVVSAEVGGRWLGIQTLRGWTGCHARETGLASGPGSLEP